MKLKDGNSSSLSVGGLVAGEGSFKPVVMLFPPFGPLPCSSFVESCGDFFIGDARARRAQSDGQDHAGDASNPWLTGLPLWNKDSPFGTAVGPFKKMFAINQDRFPSCTTFSP